MRARISADVREVLTAVADVLRHGSNASHPCVHADVLTRIAAEANRRTAYPLSATHAATALLPPLPEGVSCAKYADLLTHLLDESQGGVR